MYETAGHDDPAILPPHDSNAASRASDL